MNLLPPIPPWEGLHPLVVHFPIALLLVAPILVLVSLFVKQARSWAIAALVVMALGTAATFLAVETGAAAHEGAEHAGPAIERVLDRHEDLAETTRNVFGALTLMFAALVVVPIAMRRPLAPPVRVAASVIFLALYAGGSVLLVNTAHQGGRLVHEFGVRAVVAPTPEEPAAQAVEGTRGRAARDAARESDESREHEGERGGDRD